MEKHISEIFLYSKESTKLGYLEIGYSFQNPVIQKSCFDRIIRAMKRNSFDVGIDYNKPWEELVLGEDHFQVEYLFVGKLIDENRSFKDPEIGINIFREGRFGKGEFDSSELLNLTLIIEK